MARVNALRDVLNNKPLPRMEDAHKDIFPGTPLALVGCFVETIKARFSQDNGLGLPWNWRDDPTPTADETNDEDHPRTLFIASAYAEDPDGRDPKPAIYVGNGAQQFLRLWIGSRADIDRPTMTEIMVVHALVEMRFECVSNKRGESMILANAVAEFITGSTPDLREAFCLHDISPVQVGECTTTRRASQEVDNWSTLVATQIQTKFLFARYPIAPRLNEITIRLANSVGGFEAAATELAVGPRRTP